MVSVARALLDRGLDDPNAPTLEQAVRALSPLGKVEWGLHQLPWRGLLLVSAFNRRTNSRRWTMRNEGRKPATDTAKRVLRWITGHYQTDEREEEELRNEWEEQLLLPPDERSAGLWNEVREMREHVSS